MALIQWNMGFIFFLIINKDFIRRKKKTLHRGRNNPTKREIQPYKEGRKGDIRHSKIPYQEGRTTSNNNHSKTTKQQQQQQQQHTQTVQQQKHQSAHNLATFLKSSRATTTINVWSSNRSGAVIPAR
jgi:hypothetical protein